jgi:hypothetical protein
VSEIGKALQMAVSLAFTASVIYVCVTVATGGRW